MSELTANEKWLQKIAENFRSFNEKESQGDAGESSSQAPEEASTGEAGAQLRHQQEGRQALQQEAINDMKAKIAARKAKNDADEECIGKAQNINEVASSDALNLELALLRDAEINPFRCKFILGVLGRETGIFAHS